MNEKSLHVAKINSLLFKIYENESVVTRIELEQADTGPTKTGNDHWLIPRLRNRFEGPITIPWEQINTDGWTPFKRSVLEEVGQIPAGKTESYGGIATKIDHPGAGRAVGSVLRSNPYPVLIPCHRVIRADGSPGGYGGNPDSSLKQELIEMEE